MKNPSSWLPLLCCVGCHQALQMGDITETLPDGHIMTGTLRCTNCAQTYPILRGVPRFVPVSMQDEVRTTVSSFGYQWQRANNLVQSTAFSSLELFLDFVEPVSGDYVRGKTVLDGGCGQGRFTLAAQKLGAAQVVGVDLSDAVDAAFQNTRGLDNVLIVQADLLNLPFRAAFDYAFSVGVLHHTEKPRESFASIVSTVKTGGGVSAWVYGRENNDWIIYGLNPIRQTITSRIPRGLLWGIALLLAVPLYLAITCIYLPVSRHPSLSFMRRFLFYFDYLAWLGKYCTYREQALVVFDHLSPSLAEYIPHDYFQQWFTENRLADVVITSRANNSWRGFGTRLTAAAVES